MAESGQTPLEPLELMARALREGFAPDVPAERLEASLRMVEVMALASIAHDLRHVRAALIRAAVDRGELGTGALLTAPEPARRRDEPCLEVHRVEGEPTRRCTRWQGHAGEHVDAAGERWGGETDA